MIHICRYVIKKYQGQTHMKRLESHKLANTTLFGNYIYYELGKECNFRPYERFKIPDFALKMPSWNCNVANLIIYSKEF